MLSERDRDYYDGVQWTAEEREELEARNQQRAAAQWAALSAN
jgi:hypothetical protein